VTEFVATYSVAICAVWVSALVLTIIHSAFNEDKFTVRDLFFGVLFGPFYTMVRYSDWDAVIIRWPKRKDK